jgi:hypothetical protein
MMEEGKELAEIRAYIDAEYSQYALPTDTEPVPSEHQSSSCSDDDEVVDVCGDDIGGESEMMDVKALPQLMVPEPGNQ